MIKYLAEANPRTRLRRLALTLLLIFCAISAVVHFTVGSIIAMLLPKSEAPQTTEAAVTILTISRLREQPKPLPQALPSRVSVRPVMRLQVPTVFKIVRNERAASAQTPAQTKSMATSVASRTGSQQRHAGKSRNATVAVRSGSPRELSQPSVDNTGGGGNTSGEDVNYPGRQIPTGAVWTDNGPSGVSTTGGGIVLGGGGSRPVFTTVHSSCSPSRGDVIGGY